jgi:hypothetical protein
MMAATHQRSGAVNPKLASGFFASEPAVRIRQTASLSVGTHQENAVFYWGVVPGCAVAPNNGGGGFWSSLGSSLLSGLSQDLAAVNNYVLQPFNAGVNQLATGVGNLVDDVLPGAGSGVSNLINFAPAAAIAMATDGTSLLAEEAGSLAAESGAAAPDFIVSSGGTVYPVPEGATGPFPVESGNGFQYVGGSGGNGLDPSVSNVRLMDPTAPSGPSPGYPNGYGSYSNGAIPTPQTVNPYTGQTVSPSSPWWHIGAD